MRKISGFVLVAALLMLAVGCEDENCAGQFGCSCRSDGFCDTGLVCEGGECVYFSPPRPTDTGNQPALDSGSTSSLLEASSEAATLPAICDSVFQKWDAQCVAWEEELIQAINERRAAGADCGTQGAQPQVAALVKNEALQCAARLNSKEIIDMGDVAAQSAQKATATERAQAAGYGEGKVAENVLTNRSPASSVVDTWMGIESSCLNVMNPEFTEIGAGCSQIPDADIATVKLFLAWTVQIGGPIVGRLP